MPIVDPDTGAAVRSASNVIPDIAVDPRTGVLYVVTQQLYDLPNGPLDPGINLFTSTDGGQTWLRPGAGSTRPRLNIPAADRTRSIRWSPSRPTGRWPSAMTTSATTLPRLCADLSLDRLRWPCGFWSCPGRATNGVNRGGEDPPHHLLVPPGEGPETSRGRPSPATSSGTTRALAAQAHRFPSLFTVAVKDEPPTRDRLDRSVAPRSMKPDARTASICALIFTYWVLSLVKLDAVATVALSKVRRRSFEARNWPRLNTIATHLGR